MSDNNTAELYVRKASESLAGAESEHVNGRLDNCINRAYYACFQAAVAALLQEGIRASRGQWGHTFVQSQFVGQVINRRHRYPATLRSTLAELLTLRQSADYDPDPISRPEAARGLRRSREFVDAIRQGRGERQ
ncbi:MAG TPA: HEPN domain-containing protein [Thermomicrobiales bacterium]|nr:HEPN domain-containing protein [Thermomicrobiales bacterium]